ncbi:MAG: methyltransferase domain-containing protein [ANME-2 cluster archaeon]|nr:methyltransferase domain-containing protein [ANME-2 cluster archaeon]
MAVFEHLKEPQIVANEMYRVLTKGGAVVIGTHFMWGYHECPVDLWRYTHDGLNLIMENAGLKIPVEN